jgi:hypothetical protein
VFNDAKGSGEIVYFGPFPNRDMATGFAFGHTLGNHAALIGVFSSWQRAKQYAQRYAALESEVEGTRKVVGRCTSLRVPDMAQTLSDYIFIWNTTHDDPLRLQAAEMSDVLTVQDDTR